MYNFFSFIFFKKYNNIIIKLITNSFYFVTNLSRKLTTPIWVLKIQKIFFKKFKFKGKTYRIRILNKKLKMFFNRSHKTFLYFNKFVKFNRLRKFKFRINFIFKNDLNLFIHYIKKIRIYNIFTSRGITLNKSYFFKKKGKVSTYR